MNFYPRSPCGERLPSVLHNSRPLRISIHALLAESDGIKFKLNFINQISIHALLAESDRLWTILYSCPGNFYPRSPCGERLCLYRLPLIALPISIHALLAESDAPQPPQGESSIKFLSTLSLRRATRSRLWGPGQSEISIHALLAESDSTPIKAYNIIKGFLSTLSLRRATFKFFKRRVIGQYFYPRSPCGERPL